MTSRERRGTRYLVRLLRQRGSVSAAETEDAAWRARGDLVEMLRRVRRRGGVLVPGGAFDGARLERETEAASLAMWSRKTSGVLSLTMPAYQGRLAAEAP